MPSFLEFALLFQRALKAIQLYGADHPSTQEGLAALEEAYGELLKERSQLQISARSGRIFVDKVLEEAENLQLRALARTLEERNIHSMICFPGVEAWELSALLSVLIMKPGVLTTAGGAKKLLEDQEVTHIRILASRFQDVSDDGEVNARLLESVTEMARIARMASMAGPRGGYGGFGPGGGSPDGGAGDPGPGGGSPGGGPGGGGPGGGPGGGGPGGGPGGGSPGGGPGGGSPGGGPAGSGPGGGPGGGPGEGAGAEGPGGVLGGLAAIFGAISGFGAGGGAGEAGPGGGAGDLGPGPGGPGGGPGGAGGGPGGSGAGSGGFGPGAGGFGPGGGPSHLRGAGGAAGGGKGGGSAQELSNTVAQVQAFLGSLTGQGQGLGAGAGSAGPGSGGQGPGGQGSGGQGSGGQGSGGQGSGGQGPGGQGSGGQGSVGQGSGHGPRHADVSGFAGYLEGMGLDRSGSQPTTIGVISRALGGLDPVTRLDVFAGSADLRPGPLRNAFSRAAGTMAAPSLASAFSQGSLNVEQVIQAAEQLKALMPSAQAWAAQITEALGRGGMSEGQVKNLVEILTWESRPMEERISSLMEEQHIFEMPAEKVLAFLRELLEAGRNAEFLRVARKYATGLLEPAVARRLAVAQGFEKIADWVDIPGMPGAIADELAEMLTRTYAREKDPEVHQWVSKAVEHFIWFKLDTSDPRPGCDSFARILDLVNDQGPLLPWKEAATNDLLARLSSPERLDRVLSQLFRLDRAVAAEQIHPLLAMLPTSAANHLVERLSQEPERSRRGRIMDALKAFGPIAEGPLLESLHSQEWFVIRNTLIVLAEIAGPERVPDLQPFLEYPEPRVRLAAARTLGRIGGRGAETALTRILPRAEPGLQLEVLFLLDELKARTALPAIMELLRSARGKNRPDLDKVREKTLEVVGHLGSSTTVPALVELLARRKGFFRDSREPLADRIGALRALCALDCPEGDEAVDRTLAAEPPGPEREALLQALAAARNANL